MAIWLNGSTPFPKAEILFVYHVSATTSKPFVATEMDDLRLISQLTDLQRLGLWRIPLDGLRELLPLQNLVALDISSSPLTEADIDLLPSFKKLSAVNIVIPSDAAVAKVARLPHLNYVAFATGSTITEKGPNALKSAPLLGEVNLQWVNISESSAQAFANTRPDVIVKWRNNVRLDANQLR